MLESRSRHLSRWLRTSVCAIAQQGSATWQRGPSLPEGAGYAHGPLRIRVSGCLYLSEASGQSKSSRSQRIRRYGADSSARTVVFCFAHGDEAGPWPHGEMDAAAINVGTMTRRRARETRARSGAFKKLYALAANIAAPINAKRIRMEMDESQDARGACGMAAGRCVWGGLSMELPVEHGAPG